MDIRKRRRNAEAGDSRNKTSEMNNEADFSSASEHEVAGLSQSDATALDSDALYRRIQEKRNAENPTMKKIELFLDERGLSANDYDLYKDDPEWQALDRELVGDRGTKELHENEGNPLREGAESDGY